MDYIRHFIIDVSGRLHRTARMSADCSEGVRTMTTEAIIAVGVLIVIAMAWSAPVSHDYHTDLKNIAYQLSRIADALDRSNNNDPD